MKTNDDHHSGTEGVCVIIIRQSDVNVISFLVAKKRSLYFKFLIKLFHVSCQVHRFLHVCIAHHQNHHTKAPMV
jgi:hypothetical protein